MVNKYKKKKKIYLILLLPIVLLLAWCWTTEQERFDKASKWCTMSWYEVKQSYKDAFSNKHSYDCIEIWTQTKERERRFDACSYDCDRAIDDYRDVSNIEDLTIWCLKLCMWED